MLNELHKFRQIDQLFGWYAGQGGLGSCEAIVSLVDEALAVHAPAATRFIGGFGTGDANVFNM